MNEIHDCRDCKNYGTDYDCRENCEGRDMFESKKGVLAKIAENQKTLLDSTKAWSEHIDKHGDIL